MTQHLEISGVAKPPWSWKDDTCILSLAEALRNEQSAKDIAKRLKRSYDDGPVTASTINGAMNRANVLKSLKRLVPDAESLIDTYRSRFRTGGELKSGRKTMTVVKRQKAEQSPPPPSVYSEGRKPTREPTEEEQKQSDAINVYLASIDTRDRKRNKY